MAGEYHDLKKQHYLNLIKKCTRSGKTNREWCAENGIAYSTFMRWQALLRDEVAEQVMEQQAIVPVKITSLTPVEDHSETTQSEIRIRKGELSIFLLSSLPVAYILEIVKGLA